MIKVIIRTSTGRKQITADITDTPISIFDNIGINTSGTTVNLNGTILNSSKMTMPFSELNVADGDTINLNSIVKADGAR